MARGGPLAGEEKSVGQEVRRTLRIRVLGGLAVDGLRDSELGSRKGRTVLKLLALARGAPVSVDRIADVVWSDDQPAKPADQVGVLVSRLRNVLGADRLPRTDAGYALRCDWFDLDELARRVDEAAEALAAGRLAAARAAAEAASALARGDLLPEEDGDWVETHRAAGAALAAAARRIAAEAAIRTGDIAAAGALAELALAHDPCDEASLRILMRAHVAGGRPASALAAYARARERLAEDLGVSPSSATEKLHDAILLGDDDLLADVTALAHETTAATTTSRVAARSAQVSPLAGRTDELGQLNAALDNVRTNARSCTVLVEGEGGIGKTALVASWSSRLTSDTLVLSGRCDELGRDLPLQPLADALTAHLQGLPLDDRSALLGAELHALAPLLSVEPAESQRARDATVVVDAELGRTTLYAALCTVIDRLAGGRPAVLVIDDIHLAGPSTLGWLTFASRRLQVLVVVTARPTDRLTLRADRVIDLGPLSVEAVAELVGDGRAADLHARSGGQPLLITALIEHGDDGELPVSIVDAVERRLAGLGDAAASLRTAAALGPAVDLDVLVEVTQTPVVTLLDHLETAVRAGLLRESDGFRFRHELERIALETSLGSTRRALVHRDAARHLAARPASDPLAVAMHARLGGEARLAIDSYIAAARASLLRFDVAAAEQHLDAALDLGESADALIDRARVRMAAGKFDDAARDASRSVALTGEARAMEVAGWVAYYRRRYDEALAYADEALDRAVEPALRVSCLALAGRILHGSGHVPEAIERLTRATSLDAPAEVRGIAAIWLAQANTHAGDPTESLALLRRALVRPDRLVHPFAPLHGLFTRVLALGQTGRVRDALTACDEFDEAVLRAGATGARFGGPAANARAWILRWTGQLEEADELNKRAIAATDPAGPRAEAYYAGLLDLADGRLVARDLDGAAQMFDRLRPIETWQGTMAWHQRHRWLLGRARFALAIGERDTAAGLAAEVEKDAAARGAARYQYLAIAVGALAGGEPTSALDRLDDVVRGLGECAALDAWPTVAALGATFGVDAWTADAGRHASSIVAEAPDDRAARRFVDRLLG